MHQLQQVTSGVAVAVKSHPDLLDKPQSSLIRAAVGLFACSPVLDGRGSAIMRFSVCAGAVEWRGELHSGRHPASQRRGHQGGSGGGGTLAQQGEVQGHHEAGRTHW